MVLNQLIIMVVFIQFNSLPCLVWKIFWGRATFFKPDHPPTYYVTMKIETCTRATLIYFLMVLTQNHQGNQYLQISIIFIGPLVSQRRG